MNSQTKRGNTPAKTYRQRDKETEKVEQPDKERKHTSKNLQTERQRNREKVEQSDKEMNTPAKTYRETKKQKRLNSQTKGGNTPAKRRTTNKHK